MLFNTHNKPKLDEGAWRYVAFSYRDFAIGDVPESAWKENKLQTNCKPHVSQMCEVELNAQFHFGVANLS